MSKAKKSENPSKPPRCFYSIHPWKYHTHKDHSEIIAYVEASGDWETVLIVHDTAGANHETMAIFILAIINEHQEKRNVLCDAMDALELIINDGLTFTSEQAAEHVITNIKKVIKK